ncbi:MAG: phosphoenolpyruvate carboxylase [Eudoraea sp.]|nr:phosphoenolpyruvate carboxylase [Eudoraea sp.]
MSQTERLLEFEKTVSKKFKVYNSLFLNLPYRDIENVGMIIPLMFQQCEKGLSEGKDPQTILDTFFTQYTDAGTEIDKIDFMFKIIQYVERQVVLYDSVEDAAFPKLHEHTGSLSIKDYTQFAQKNERWDQFLDKLSNFSARIVLTAHPTQFYTPAVLNIMRELRSLMPEDHIDGIDMCLQQLGLTSLINRKKPTPLDEAKNIIYVLRYIYYDAIAEFYQHIKSTVDDQSFANFDLIKLGFWPGGDRDGNPFVTADITRQVAEELRMTLMKCYYQDLKDLQQKLSFNNLQDLLQELREGLYRAMFDPEKNLTHSYIKNILIDIRKILIEQYHGLYLGELDRFMDKVDIFKTHFAVLDIRQDHSAHVHVVTQVLKKSGKIKESLSELDESELMDLLLEADFKVDPSEFEDTLVKDTLENISQLSEIQERNGEEGCNRYIISNSEDTLAVLFVFGLFRWCGWSLDNLSFDIIPLFETMKGMADSSEIMDSLFNLPVYRKHVANRNNNQTMMLGFSDGTKDGGYVKANWSILKTKEKLSDICAAHQVKAIFFDGRGGPPARGGGKTHRFYAAQTDSVANHEIQLTIQGQTITSTYGTQPQFIHNSEQLLTAGLASLVYDQDNIISEENRKLLEEISELSFNKYNDLKNHEQFIPYLEKRSTLPYYKNANIGSRPGKRGQKKELTLKDLRAISFVGSWSQLKQNVPGYYGIGTALRKLEGQGRIKDLERLYTEVPFFNALMSNSMMSLSKCYFELTLYMKTDKVFGSFWETLFEEYTLSETMLLKISGTKVLMDDETLSRESIRIRENIVLPLLVIQQYALQHISKESEHKERYEKLVTRSLYGNINASRNSA